MTKLKRLSLLVLFLMASGLGLAQDGPPVDEQAWKAVWNTKFTVETRSTTFGYPMRHAPARVLPFGYECSDQVEGVWIGAVAMSQSERVALVGPPEADESSAAAELWQVGSWREALEIANLASKAEGLEPCYDISDDRVVSESGFCCTGYRLPHTLEHVLSALKRDRLLQTEARVELEPDASVLAAGGRSGSLGVRGVGTHATEWNWDTGDLADDHVIDTLPPGPWSASYKDDSYYSGRLVVRGQQRCDPLDEIVCMKVPGWVYGVRLVQTRFSDP